MGTPIGRVLGLVVSALATVFSPAAVSQVADPPAAHPFAQSQPIPGRYIVVFKPSVANPAAEAAAAMGAAGAGAQLLHVYSNAIKGFAATLPDQALNALRNNPNVDYIEQDQTVSLSTTTENNATWGLDRIDEHTRVLNSQYTYNQTGAGVTAFIIDTGIRADHVDFGGRVRTGVQESYSAINDGRGTNDCNGHGTHVAGTVGGSVWGVAKGVTLVPVRVLDCRGSGTWSGVIAGVDWVAAPGRPRPAVANMSLGGGKSSSVNSAVANAVATGVTMAVAAGNSTADACNYSPASEPSAITVGATTSTDVRSSYSNYGACVDIFAPGSSITSAWYTSSTATNTISGTSMASPHVAGAAALAAEAQKNQNATPAGITSYLLSSATTGVLSSVGSGSPNLLLYSLGGGSTSVQSTSVRVASLTGKGMKNGRNWKAQVTATVTSVDPSNPNVSNPVANVTVSGSFAPEGGAASCVTGGSGSCALTSSPMDPTMPTSTKFTVTNLSGTNITYASGSNVVGEIMIYKP
jgi:aqualysin 1